MKDFKQFKEEKNDFDEYMEDFDFFPYLLDDLGLEFQRISSNHFEEISWKQYALIECINRCGENPTLIELADYLNASYQKVKQILTNLENKGYVTLTQDNKDHRKQRISLTDSSVVFLQINSEPYKAFLNKAFAKISKEDFKTTINTLLTISDNLKPSSTLEITTYDKSTVLASDFSYREIYPNRINRPHYQLYATRGPGLKISGINRTIIGFYSTKEELNKELAGIYSALTNDQCSYCVCHAVPVIYDLSGMPLLSNT